MANEAWREPVRDMSPWPRLRRWVGRALARISIKLLNR